MVSIHMFYEKTIHAHALENQTTVLRVGVVQKRYFRELVSAGKNGTNPTGFCVEVFKKAIEPLNLTVEYITYGNGADPPPSYDELIQLIVDKVYLYSYCFLVTESYFSFRVAFVFRKLMQL